MKTPLPTWKPSDIIRNLKTGKAYMVLQVIKGHATIIAPMDQTELPPTQTLFTRDYHKFIRACDTREENGTFTRDIITL